MNLTRTASALTPLEFRASLSLSAIFALRMLGLFLVLPVFAIEAAHYPGGHNPAMIGLAMGVYGLTQALLQFFYGWASDRLGRKRVIVLGLLVFAGGSLVAMQAVDVTWLMIGRAIQGAGAISAAVTALLADLTRDPVRTKSMALIGVSIGLMFAVSLVTAPLLAARIGLAGIFGLTALLALMGIAGVLWWVPPEPVEHRKQSTGPWSGALHSVALMRLYLGVFILHAVQLAMWMAVPNLLEQAGLGHDHHWQVYLPAVLGSFVLMGASLFRLEKRGYLRAIFLVSIGLAALVQLGLCLVAIHPSGAGGVGGVGSLAVLLFVFFYGFNVLEASQPSMVSKLAPVQVRGAAMGVYNTLQSLGLFAGGVMGGWLVQHSGPAGLFAVCCVLMLAWLVVAWPMYPPRPPR